MQKGRDTERGKASALPNFQRFFRLERRSDSDIHDPARSSFIFLDTIKAVNSEMKPNYFIQFSFKTHRVHTFSFKIDSNN